MKLLLPALILFLGQEGPKAGEPAIVIKNVRILTAGKADFEKGVIVLSKGKIEAVGDVPVPDKATVIDGAGLVAMPGWINAYTRFGGLAGSTGNSQEHLAKDELNPANDRYRIWIRSGFTTLVLYPGGGTISGQAVAYKPRGVTRDQMILQSPAYLRLDMEANTQIKDLLKAAFEVAKKAGEGRKPRPGPAPSPSPAATPGPAEPAKEEKTNFLAQVVRGELRGVIELSSPSEYLHFTQVASSFLTPATRISYVCPGDMYRAADVLGAKKERILVRPEIPFVPFTRTRVNAISELSATGCTVGLFPSDSIPELESYLFRVSQVVKLGWARDQAIRAMTIVPAEIAGIEKRVGSIEAGKDGDIVLLDGDPFSGSARIVKVFIDGRIEFEVEK